MSLLIACGGSRDSAPDGAVGDGAVDASNDAGVDAPPDATPCVTPDDRDGDGVCDSNDVCPDVPDPGQADLDGDHIGWMCDPVESVTLDGQGLPAFVQRRAAARSKQQLDVRLGDPRHLGAAAGARRVERVELIARAHVPCNASRPLLARSLADGHDTVASATAHGGDGGIQQVLATQLATMQVKLTIFRMIGPGTFTP